MSANHNLHSSITFQPITYTFCWSSCLTKLCPIFSVAGEYLFTFPTFISTPLKCGSLHCTVSVHNEANWRGAYCRVTALPEIGQLFSTFCPLSLWSLVICKIFFCTQLLRPPIRIRPSKKDRVASILYRGRYRYPKKYFHFFHSVFQLVHNG